MTLSKPKWYVLYTSPRAEKQVADRLKMAGITCWLPLHKAPRVWSDRVKIVDMPLYNSYVFVNCHEPDLYKMLKVYGVVRIVFYDGKPAVVREEEIEGIRLFLEEAACHELCVGEDVEILCGAMKHVSGKVKRIKKKYLSLFIEPLGATVCVNLNDVAKLKRL